MTTSDRVRHQRSLSAAVDDYTKAIDALELAGQGDGAITTSMLAERLGVTAPSVSGMLRKLDDLGYLDYLPYHGFELSESGRRHARSVVRRHRLIEQFLYEVLGVSWDKVHDEAEQLEHAISPQLCDLIAERLGHPALDPHGDPIPDADGSIAERQLWRLHDVADGTTVSLERVSDRDSAVLRALSANDIALGDTFVKVRADDKGIVVQRKKHEISFDDKIVAAMLVEPMVVTAATP